MRLTATALALMLSATAVSAQTTLTLYRGLLPDGAKSYAKPIKRAFRGP